ncbi:MAG: hypothetical protein M3415_08380 [Actinomycetota bacterium]|jgi:hypothetical protein|nr:hypothetical protein [Actinomycetota bacterium]
MPTALRTAVAGALAGSAKVLSFTSNLLDATARTLRTAGPTQAPSEEPAPADTADVVERIERQVVAEDLGRVTATADELATSDAPDHQRRASSHIEELAERPASEVIAAIADLSTDELRLLTEYELAHRKRKTVLAALEQAASP